MTQREMFEKSFQRPTNFFKLDGDARWVIDLNLGILDWDANESDLSKSDLKRFIDHYEK